MSEHDWVLVGRFGRPHGLQGLVSVVSFTQPAQNILSYVPWYIGAETARKAIVIAGSQMQNAQILVRLDEYSNRDAAASLTNVEIFVKSAQLPALNKDEYYWHQLMGMDVRDSHGHSFGKVCEMMATGANDVLVVEGDKRHLIPFLLDDVVLSIDIEQGCIVVNWDWDF